MKIAWDYFTRTNIIGFKFKDYMKKMVYMKHRISGLHNVTWGEFEGGVTGMAANQVVSSHFVDHTIIGIQLRNCNHLKNHSVQQQQGRPVQVQQWQHVHLEHLQPIQQGVHPQYSLLIHKWSIKCEKINNQSFYQAIRIMEKPNDIFDSYKWTHSCLDGG